MITEIKIEKIQANPWQTRQEINQEYIQDLAADIKRNGLLQVPLGRIVSAEGKQQALARYTDDQGVNLDPDHFVQIAFGHNRLAAYKHNNSRQMPVDLINMTDQKMADYAWSENERRQDITPIERARAIKQRMDDFGWTQQEVADHLGMSRPAVGNVLRLLKLPDEIQGKIQDGDISERQAMAALPLVTLPKEVRDRAEDSWSAKPSRIMEDILNGESSENIRWQVDRLKQWNTKDLTRASWPLEHKFISDDVRSNTCNSCRKRLKGDPNRCIDYDCYELKEEIWKREQLEGASRELNIPVVSDEDQDQGITPLSIYRGEQVQQACSQGCENLRLKSGSYYWSLAVLGIMDINDVSLWCVSKGSKCQCLARLDAEQKKNDPELKAEKERQRQIDKIMDAGSKQLAEAISTGNLEVWRWMMGMISYQLTNKGESWDLADIHYHIARVLLSGPASGAQDVAAMQYVIDKILADLGVIYQAPEDDLLADINRRWDRLKSWVDRLDKEIPTLSQVKGNQVNLVKIMDDIRMISNDLEVPEDGANPFHFEDWQLDDLMARLGDFVAVLQDSWWGVIDQEKKELFDNQLEWITTAEVDGDFETRLDDVPIQILAYAYALISGQDGHGIRAGKIRPKVDEYLYQLVDQAVDVEV